MLVPCGFLCLMCVSFACAVLLLRRLHGGRRAIGEVVVPGHHQTLLLKLSHRVREHGHQPVLHREGLLARAEIEIQPQEVAAVEVLHQWHIPFLALGDSLWTGSHRDI